ncbi:NnrS family protein [Chelatococcus sp. SYSU_G07232]|uniref:NnrS family protein n=1 Tax=Chelatococcus albus TaxID=3047466 RepID=A0ABT7AFQ2_9HYPH|nr:NnrS family protein [Chelatococcus sp. SYSU_G07232]MDJ1158211.1 NnrS family protein [Chelatococcus sp. SYSU_G07232]
MRGPAAAAIAPHRLFFSLALAQGALSILLWTFASPPPDGPFWHAHEMVFGYGLAVVAGFLLTKTGSAGLLALAAAWAAARLAALVPNAPALLRDALAFTSTAAIAGTAAQTFLRGAKRGGNLVFPALMLFLPVGEGAFLAGEAGLWPGGERAGAWFGLGLIVMLIAAMGGRIAGAAVSGASQRRGGPRLAPDGRRERLTLAALAGGFAATGLDAPALFAAGLLVVGGVLLLLRVTARGPGLRPSPADVRAVVAGQVWLGLGCLATGLASLLPLPLPPAAAFHLATIGGIGGTTLVMMLRTVAQRERAHVPPAVFAAVAALVGAAALLRALGFPAPGGAYAAAALVWTAAFGIVALAVFCLRSR